MMARELEFDETAAFVELPKNSIILHETHTSHGTPPYGTCWKDFWINALRGVHEWPLGCSLCRHRAATVAAHITSLGLNGIFLLPVCSDCNFNPSQKQKRQKLCSSAVVVAVPASEQDRILQLQSEDPKGAVTKCRNCQRAVCVQTTCGGGSKIFCCLHCRCTKPSVLCGARRANVEVAPGGSRAPLAVGCVDADDVKHTGGVQTPGGSHAPFAVDRVDAEDVKHTGGVQAHNGILSKADRVASEDVQLAAVSRMTRSADFRLRGRCRVQDQGDSQHAATSVDVDHTPREKGRAQEQGSLRQTAAQVDNYLDSSQVDRARDLHTPEPVRALDEIVDLLCSITSVEQVEVLIRTTCPSVLTVKITLKPE